MKDLNELRRKRGNIIKDMRSLTDKAEVEKRELTTEENDQWSRMDADQEKLRVEIEREEKQRKLDGDTTNGPVPMPGAGAGENRAVEVEQAAFRSLLLNGPNRLGEPERRALQMDVNAGGGYWIAPQAFSQELIQAVDNEVFVRGLATVESVPNAQSLGIPSLDADPADPTWTAEIATGTEDSTMAAGKRELFPHPLAKLIKVSNKLLRASANRVDALVRERLAYKIAVVLEAAYMTGSGANQPLGLFTASASGINTDRDVSTGNTTTAIKADNLINCKYTLKSQYQRDPSLRWIFHRDAVKAIRQLKDGEGQYLWRPGLASDTGDTILSVPFVMSEYAPNTFTAGLYVGLLGVLRFYRVADALTLAVQVLNELYAATNQTGYIVRFETDGAPVLSEAFVRVKLAAS